MKKLFLVSLFAFAICTVSFAQEPGRPMTKEEKAAAKAKKEQELTEALEGAGLTKDQQKQVRDVLEDAAEKGKEIKNDPKLSEEEKAAKKEAINSAKNDKLKEIMGADKYKIWNQIRKKQKEQNTGGTGTPPPPPPPPPVPADK